jgi:CBS domain-containing protein
MTKLVTPGSGVTSGPRAVRDLMTRDVSMCAPGAPLSEAARIMWQRDCGFVPVTDEARTLRGVVTDRDACMAAYTRGVPLAQIRVDTVMSTDVASVREDDTLARAHDLMRARQVRRLPVLDSRGRVVGVLSLNDVALHASGQEGGPRAVAETLEAVSGHRDLAAR